MNRQTFIRSPRNVIVSYSLRLRQVPPEGVQTRALSARWACRGVPRFTAMQTRADAMGRASLTLLDLGSKFQHFPVSGRGNGRLFCTCPRCRRHADDGITALEHIHPLELACLETGSNHNTCRHSNPLHWQRKSADGNRSRCLVGPMS